MKNYKIVLSYDGAGYKGWQRLGNHDCTIQGTLERVISELIGEQIEVIGSGRTDAGVHARGQVANFKIAKSLGTDFQDKLNQRLPDDIRVTSVALAADGFHSRYNATAKTYKYYLDTREKAGVFTRKYTYHLPYQLNVSAMQCAADYLKGTHDYSAFTDDKVERSRVRTIQKIKIQEQDGIITFEYHGDGFMYHMVRIITGTLLEVGMNKRKAEEIINIMKSKERALAGYLVPAKGLFLEKVYYS